MGSLWEKPVSHGQILKRIWKHLDLAVLEAKHPFHTPVFATINAKVPEARVVVLRRFWRRPPMLAFHTHAGSPKLDQIRESLDVSWLFYHPGESIQARITGVAEIHTNDDLVEEQWAATSLLARRCYLGAVPSQVSKKPTHGMPDEFVDREPTPEESRRGRSKFAVVSTSVRSIDFLELDVKGHRRSRFTWHEDGIEMKWLVP